MKIGLNLLPVVPGIGGTWTYVKNLLEALAEHDIDNEYVAFATKASGSVVPKSQNFTRVDLPIDASIRPLRVAFENTALPYILRAHQLDCMHHFFGALPFGAALPSVVTVHDVMVYTRPSDFSPLKRRYLRYMRRRAAEHARVLAPVSNATALHLNQIFGVPLDRMQVIPATLGPRFHRVSEDDVRRFRSGKSLPERFWLCVAQPYAHKNYDRLLAAFAQLRRESPGGPSLVIRGERTSELAGSIEAFGLARHVVFIPPLEADEMPILYSAAFALIFPSLFEGGGIPVMEAIACGCPVVASDIATTREFAGDAALRFDPADGDSIFAAMREFESSSSLRHDLAAATANAPKALSGQAAAARCARAYGVAVSHPTYPPANAIVK